LYLSISASSPFLNNKITENHSQRWIQFPKTPSKVPFFVNHNSYIEWIEKNIYYSKVIISIKDKSFPEMKNKDFLKLFENN